jgi:hypothetical protein
VRVSPTAGGWQINLGAPEGNYQTGTRSFVFNIRTTVPARSATLDNRPLGPLQANAKANGWLRNASGITIRIADDRRAHRIEVK